MKAIVQNGYGSADVISLKEVEKPELTEDGVLVRVHAASLGAGDLFAMRGSPYIVRFSAGFPNAKDYIQGYDIAGVVEAVGKDVTDLQPGDEVFGETGKACAEYVSTKAEKLARKPSNATFEQASAVPVSGTTALQGLRDVGKVQPGEHVLVNGASGGVGTFAVQIAEALGAEVTGVCSGRNEEMVRSIGADHTIDYGKEDFTRGGPRYDVIFDLVANHPASECRRALTPTGRHVPSSGHAGMGWIACASMASLFNSQQQRPFLAVAKRSDLEALTELIEDGKVTPVIDSTYSLAEGRQAFAHFDTGHTRGKIVIQVIGSDGP